MAKFYYDEIKKLNSNESNVDNFYNNTLPLYFPDEQYYGIEQESRTPGELGLSQTDFTIRCVRNGQLKRVVVLENKATRFESQRSAWRRALDEIIRYVSLIRNEESPMETEPIHIILAIGTYLRAYTHQSRAEDADDFHLYPRELLELQKDEEKVHNLLTEMNRITQH